MVTRSVCGSHSWHESNGLRRACSSVDTVLHLAAMNEIDAVRDPVGALEMNGVNSVRLLGSQGRRVACLSIFPRLMSMVHRLPDILTGIPFRVLDTRMQVAARAAEDAVLAASDDGA